MFTKETLGAIKEKTESQLRITLQERIKKLQEDYQENPFISKAEVFSTDEDIHIELQLEFSSIDAEEQNIPLVFEYGGVLYRDDGTGKKEIVVIEPGLYITRNIIQGE
jgi:hypothetical protein